MKTNEKVSDPFLNRWQKYGEDGIASEYIVNASYLNIEKIALSKYFSFGYYKRKEILLELNASNLFTFSKIDGFTPNPLFGQDINYSLIFFNQPILSQIGLNLKIKL